MLFIALAAPVLLFGTLKSILPEGPYVMDQGEHKGNFFPILILYCVWSILIAALSSFGCVFCYNDGLRSASFLFAVALVESIVFIVWLVFCYEGYLHAMAAGKSNYTRIKYAATLTLGVSVITTSVAAVAVAVTEAAGR